MNLECETEHDPQGNEDLEEQEEKKSFLKTSTGLVTGAVHEKLTLLPRKIGLSIAIAIILCDIGFVISLTIYNAHNCSLQMANIDGSDFESIFKEVHKKPNFLCSTIIDDPNDEFPAFPVDSCLLEGFTYDDYNHRSCPSDGIVFYQPEGEKLSNCFGTTSVVYIVCPSFTVAFGAAFAFATPIQIVLLIITFAIYQFFFKKNSVADAMRELEDVCSSKFKKQFSKKELETMVAAQSFKERQSLTKPERELDLTSIAAELENSSSSEPVAGSAKVKATKQQPQDEEQVA